MSESEWFRASIVLELGPLRRRFLAVAEPVKGSVYELRYSVGSIESVKDPDLIMKMRIKALDRLQKMIVQGIHKEDWDNKEKP